jgi:hypothetical protein
LLVLVQINTNADAKRLPAIDFTVQKSNLNAGVCKVTTKVFGKDYCKFIGANDTSNYHQYKINLMDVSFSKCYDNNLFSSQGSKKSFKQEQLDPEPLQFSN